MADSTIYVVLARCNFDDVLVGAYLNRVQANRRAAAVHKDPSKRQKTTQAHDTEFLFCSIFEAENARVREIARTDGAEANIVELGAARKREDGK